MTTTRITSFAIALLIGASTANAQALATFGSAEVAGYGEGSALLGTSLSTGHLGLGPVATLVGQTYRYRNAPGSHAQAWAVSPSLGLQYAMPDGAVQGSLGYTFVSTEFTGVVSGNESGGTNGAFVTGQVNHWGTGEHTAQWIGNYGFKSEYYWTRARFAQRFVDAPHPIYLGVEGVLQGTQKETRAANGTLLVPTQMRYEFGPTLEYRVSNDFRVGGSAGFRGGNNNAPSSGYVRIEFLALSRL